MKFKNNLILAAAVSLALGAPFAHADTFLFSPTGDGANLISVGTIDQAPGNALAVGGVTATQLAASTGTPGQTFQLYYQANLNSFLSPTGTPVYTDGQIAGKNFTFTASFTEQIVGFSQSTFGGVTTQTAIFNLAPVQVDNYYRIFASTTPGDNNTGANFNTGTKIFQGTVVSEPVGNYSATTQGGTLSPLDSYTATPGDNYPGVLSVTGGGQTTFNVSLVGAKGDFASASYFPQFANSIITSNFTTNNGSPFTQVDPSRCVATNVGCIAPNVGTVNGATGPDFLLQADASQTVRFVPNQVPEPATTAMLGLGLAMLGFFGVSRKKNNV